MRQKRGVFIGGAGTARDAAEWRDEGATYGTEEAAECVDVRMYLPSARAERLALIKRLLECLVSDQEELVLPKRLVAVHLPSKWRRSAL